MSKNKHQIDSLLFKPLILDDGKEEDLIIIFGCDDTTRRSISAQGKITKESNIIIHVLNVTKTVLTDDPVISTFNIYNMADLKKSIKEVNIITCLEDLGMCHQIILNNMAGLSMILQNLGKSLTAIKLLTNDKSEPNQGNLIIGTNSIGLAHIVYSNISGNGISNLAPEEIEKIGGVIMDVISSHSSDDLDDQEQVKRLTAELEYKILESLPINVKAGDININMRSIIDEIKRYQNDNDNDNNNLQEK